MDPRDLEVSAASLINYEYWMWDSFPAEEKIRREKEAERLFNKASMLKLEQTGRIYKN